MKYPSVPKVSLDFKKKGPNDLIGFANGVKTALTGSTVFTDLKVPLPDLGTQIGDLVLIEETIESGDNKSSNLLLRDSKANKLALSLTANAHSVEDTAIEVAAGDELIAEQLILTTGYTIADKATHKPRNFGVVELGPGWAHVRTVKTQKRMEIIHWQYGITPAKGIPPATLTRHTTDKVDIVITGLPSGSWVGLEKAGAELASKVKKWEHPSFNHAEGENLDWSDFIYFVIP
jgi:hypothetical protein